MSHTLTSTGHDASEDGTGRGTPIIGTHGRADETPTGTLTRMYSEQSGQDFGGGAGVIATASQSHLEQDKKTGRLEL